MRSMSERCAKEHPFHVLPTIVALANASSASDNLDTLSGRTRDSVSSVPEKAKSDSEERGRIAGANQLLAELRASDRIKTHVDELLDLSRRLMQLSLYKSSDKNNLEIPPSFLLDQPYASVAVLTNHIPVSRSRKRLSTRDVPTVARYEGSFAFVGGINAPKKILCRGSDGRVYVQLLKGNDDMRQDAVMQQVFNVVNALFAESENQEITRLRLRTYKVVPLSPKGGVLEWCSNAEPISLFLVGWNLGEGAHTRLRPQDASARDCRKDILDVAKKSFEERHLVFMEVCRKIQPVFRYFFFENFRNPGKWFERRQAYTKSVAVSSIVGYILGLGDRHVNNILIDKRTAEVVHIDFGIAFDKGQTLPTPETVPFRLTRDIIDGMGALGVSGTFTKSCERVMQSLRDAAGEVILTVLEVFLWDPLYDWDVSEEKLMMVQSEDAASLHTLERSKGRKSGINAPSTKQDLNRAAKDKLSKEKGRKNEMASRALATVREKLQGIVDGHPLSVPGQTAYLIQQARDSGNLSRLGEAKEFERCELARTLRYTFGFDRETLGDWVCLVRWESSFDTSKKGGPNSNGSFDHGLFQINDGYWCYPPPEYADCNIACDDLRDDDITDDIDCVRIIFNRHGFIAWHGWENFCNGTDVENDWVADCNVD
ncbi:unnamed protein product [Notodromas monacha]|uniref:PI3K/PI4K catalytic domain-containing protein n=1 Tax=Notodromas monacha TaxID=399045 RepID=A0A7R9GFG9_9CRUS|nr:unnamed protein product [Notodromas monacha]CAG0918835.1 unnamed protein product [Notodromas monacha]